MLSRLRIRLGEERAFALVLALGLMVVLAISVTAVVDYTSSNTHHAARSKADEIAYSLAEAGLNNAESILNKSNADGTTKALTPGTLTGTYPCPDGTSVCFMVVYNSGTSLWKGVYSSNQQYWSVTSWGQVHNPTGATASVVQRKIGATIQVVADPSQVANVAAFNYLFATQSTGGCDVTLGQGVTVDYSIYAAGNICLSNTAVILKPVSGDAVNVVAMGTLSLQSPQNAIGSSSTPIDSVSTTKCSSQSNPTLHWPCGSADKIWASSFSNNPQALISPTSTTYWTAYYGIAHPGPENPCTSSSGAPPPFTDADGTLNLATNGSNGTFNITSATAYSCTVTDYYGKTIGQMSWAPPSGGTPGTLTILGVIYCDCSMTMSNNAMNVYNGFGSLYLTGTFAMTGSQTRFCASQAAGVSDCDFSGVFGSIAQTEMLVIAANGNDGSGNSITFAQGTEFQGALVAIHNISVGQSSTFQGAMITPSISIGQSAVIKPLPVLQFLPLGAPGNPTTHATAQAPVVSG